MTNALLATRTTTRLLDALREQGNEPAWTQVDTRYRPVIAGLARRLGLTESDADEVAQQSLAEFAQAYRNGNYDRSKGRLSSWLLGIARNIALRELRAGRRDQLVGQTVLSDVPDEETLRTIWADERDRAVLMQAISILREQSSIDERTILAFEFFALRGVSAAQVAEQCGMTVDQVYVAKTRVTKALRTIVTELTAAYEEDT